jgi:Tol biopolymer transport system component
MKRVSVGAFVAVCGVVACAPGVAAAAPGQGNGDTRLVSVSTRGVQGNLDSELPAVSADGRFVAFVSLADNLVPGDTNESADVFVMDLHNGHTDRVSTSSFGRQGNGNSGLLEGMGGPAISADGRFVAFDSAATNLVLRDTNRTADVFVKDRRTGRTTRVSVDSHGQQGNGSSTQPAISADGRRVAFSSFADNLVAPDTNFSSDIFVRDRAAGRTVRASDGPDGTQANNLSFEPALNGNGHLVVFTSFADNLGGNPAALGQVFLRNLDTGRVDAVSSPPTSTDPLAGSGQPAISRNGRFVVFDSQTTDLFPDGNGHVRDAVLLDRATGRYEAISRDDTGTQGNDNSTGPVVSADGRFVAYTSFASNLVAGDANNRLDVFVRDRRAGTTRLVSTSSAGAPGDLDSETPTIDADGGVIAYASDATTLAPETDQGFFAFDIFVRDRS